MPAFEGDGENPSRPDYGFHDLPTEIVENIFYRVPHTGENSIDWTIHRSICDALSRDYCGGVFQHQYHLSLLSFAVSRRPSFDGDARLQPMAGHDLLAAFHALQEALLRVQEREGRSILTRQN